MRGLVAGVLTCRRGVVARAGFSADAATGRERLLCEHPDPTKQGVTANNLVVVSNEGVLVADGQGTVDNVKRSDRRRSRRSRRSRSSSSSSAPSTATISGGDAAFPESATFLVHPNSKAVIERRIGRTAELVSDKRAIKLGGTEVDVLFLGRAHTGGDLEVYLPREKVLFMSEVFSNRIFPSMANGFPSEWLAALKKAEQMDVNRFGAGAHRDERAAADEADRARTGADRARTRDLRREAPARREGAGRRRARPRRLRRVCELVEAIGQRAAGALKRVYMELDGELK